MVVVDAENFNAAPVQDLSAMEMFEDEDGVNPLQRAVSNAGGPVQLNDLSSPGGINNEDGFEISKPKWDKNLPKSGYKYLKKKFKNFMSETKVWFFLMSLGSLTAFMGLMLDVMVKLLATGRLFLNDQSSLTALVGYPMAIIWGIVWVCAAIFCCKKLSVYAKGSGTPEMKTILAGTMLLGPLSTRCFIAKLMGLVFGIGAGLSIGKEGPFIHMSCILGYQLTALPYFASLRRNERLLRQLIAASVSAGITAAFGAPIGGVMFGIEVTATYYQVNNLWRSYLTAVSCIVMSKILDYTNEKDDFKETNLAEAPISWELVLYMGLGLLCGVGGALFVHTVSRFQKLFNFTLKNVSSYVIGSIVISATVAVNFFLPFMLKDDIATSNDLFVAGSMAQNNLTAWTTPNVYVTMPLHFLLKLIFTSAAVSLPLPCGLYLPMFVLGASAGRWYGEVLQVIFGAAILPGAYAVVGAAAFVAGATHTVATAVIVFELTGQLTHMIPVLTGVLVARAVAPGFSVPIYDLLMSIKNLPYLAAAKMTLLVDRTALDLVEEDPKYLTIKSTYLEAYDLVMATTGRPTYEEVAVVDPDTLLLVGSVTRRSLVKAIDNFALEALRRIEDSENVFRVSSPTEMKEEGKEGFVRKRSTSGDGLKVKVRVGSSESEEDEEGESIMYPQPQNTQDAKDQADFVRANLHRMRHGIERYFNEYFSPETYQLMSYELVSPSKYKPGDEKMRSIFNDQMHFATNVSPQSSSVKIDPAPMSIPDATPLTKVHFIFTITQWTVIFITHKGKFKGVIGKNDIAVESSKKAIDKYKVVHTHH